MAAKVTPSTPGAPSFSSASSYASRSVSILQTWTYSPQKRQDVSAFALTYSLRLRSCKLMDAFVISSLPSRLKETLQTAGSPCSVGVTPLPRSDGPVRHPHAFGRLPGLAGYTTYLAPVDFSPGRAGFTNHSMCPCHRAVASTPPRWECRIGQISAPHAAFAQRVGARPSDLVVSRPQRVHRCYGPVTRNLPKGDLVDGLQDLGGFGHPRHPAIRTTGLLTFALAGLPPAEHISLHWSQHPIPLHVSAFGPRTRSLAAKLTAGWLNFIGNP